MMFNYPAVRIIKFRVPAIRFLAESHAVRIRNSGTRNLIGQTAGQLNIMSPNSSGDGIK